MLEPLIIPVLWFPDQSNDDWEEQLYSALEANLALGDFMNGRTQVDEYLDHIAELGIDPLTLGEKLDELECQPHRG
jgi:hypothetical protein